MSLDIDERMAALLKDQQEMGGRPTEEPDSGDDTYEDALPLTRKGSKETVAEEVAKEKKAAKAKPTK